MFADGEKKIICTERNQQIEWGLWIPASAPIGSHLCLEREKWREREENGKVLLHELGQKLLPFWDVSAFPAESTEVKAVHGIYFNFISKKLYLNFSVPLRCAVAVS